MKRLSDVLSDFARTMLTDFPIQAILDHLVVRIVDILPVGAAGVTLISPLAGPHYVAASDASALRYEELQTELGEGPCLAAYTTGEAVSVADLTQGNTVQGVRPAGTGGRAPRGVHVSASPWRQAARCARPLPHHSGSTERRRHGHRSDPG